MKLLIDIDEEKYNWLKENNPNADKNSIVGAITNGIPYIDYDTFVHNFIAEQLK